MLKTQKEFSGLRLFQQHVGLFFKYNLMNEISRAKRGDNIKEIFMRYSIKVGIPGMSDLFGILDGRFIAIEVKTGSAKQSKAQKNYEKIIRSLGGVYIVGRSSKQVIEELKKVEEKP